MRVLVAEDEALIRMDLVEMLEEEGYAVVGEAADGGAAVTMATELRPDLVLLDVKMPVLDGLSGAQAGQKIGMPASQVFVSKFRVQKLLEQELDHLSGYENARPVRVGNAAHSQAQHDVWGAVLDSLYLHTRSRDSLPERVWPMLCTQVEAAIANWAKPDRGIWEVRGEPRHFTSSTCCIVHSRHGSACVFPSAQSLSSRARMAALSRHQNQSV